MEDRFGKEAIANIFREYDAAPEKRSGHEEDQQRD